MSSEETLKAYDFEFDPAKRILRCTFRGRVTDEDLTNFYRMAAKHVSSLDPDAGVTDFSAVTSFEVTSQTIRALAMSAPAMPQASRPRIILAASAHIFGMARMFEFEGEATRPNLHVVRTLEEAWIILGIEAPNLSLYPKFSIPPLSNWSCRLQLWDCAKAHLA